MFERFVFDNTVCNEYGIMCCSFERAGLVSRAGQTTNLETEKATQNNIFHIISQQYSEPITYTMQIINRDFSPITAIQERTLKKWLCQRDTYKLFAILDKRYADTWFYANINNPKMIYFYDTIGMEFTITTNAPYAFSDERDYTFTLAANDIVENLYVSNDEELPVYPDLVITPTKAGTLTFTNLSITDSDNQLKITNCSANEVLTIECGYPYISSSLSSHNVFNDFNKFWPYFIDGYNRITVNLPCEINMKYREYRKVTIV